MKTLLAEFKDGDIHVLWYKVGASRYTVRYGAQRLKFNNYIEACHEYGECVAHALVRVGKMP